MPAFQGVAPPARDYGASLIGDSSGNLLLFGGRTNAGVSFNDVWVHLNASGPLNAGSWYDRMPFGTPPPPRYNAGIAYDEFSDRLVVFGGCEGACLPASNDVWVLYNAFGRNQAPAVWQQRVTSGTPPSPRHAMLAVYGAFNQLMIYGGHDGANGVFTDIWTLDNAFGFPGPSQWQALAASGSPHPGAVSPTGVYDSNTDTLIVAGGYDSTGQPTNAVHVLTPVLWSAGATWTNTIPEGAAGSPPAFGFAGGAFDWLHRRLLVTLPNDATDSQDVWSLQGGTTWTQRSFPNGPSPTIAVVQGMSVDTIGTVRANFAGQIPLSNTWAVSLQQQPVFTTITPAEGATFTLRQGERFIATIEAEDPDPWGTVSVAPDMPAPPYATLTYSPRENRSSVALDWDTSHFVGTVQFTFTAMDDDSMRVTRSFTVNVTPDSSPYFVSPPSPLQAFVITTGMPVAFTVQAADPDPGDFALLTIVEESSNLPANAVVTGGGFSPYQVSWTPAPNQTGTFSAQFKVTDQAGQYLLWGVRIDVLPNHAPVFDSSDAVTVTLGEPRRFYINAHDFDPFFHVVSITPEIATLPPGTTISYGFPPDNFASLELSWTPGPGSVGHHFVHFVASDQYGASADQYLDISVIDPPAPSLVSISVSPSPAMVHVGQGQNFQATGRFSDGSTKLLPSGPANPALGGAPLWQTLFSPPLDVGVCATAQYPVIDELSSQVFTGYSGGAVNEVWPPESPVLRVDGGVNFNSVYLNLRCNYDTYGTIDAVWTGTQYEGTFTFDGASGQVSIRGWSPQFPLQTPRFGAGAASDLDHIYAIGGMSGSSVLATTEVFFATIPGGGWAGYFAPMPTAREGLAVGAAGNLIFAIGGRVAGGAASGVVEAFDFVTDQWSTGYAQMPTPRAHMMIAQWGGKLYVFGGDTGPSNTGITNVVESYDPATDTWTTMTPMPTARNFGLAGAFSDGRIAVIGGSTVIGNSPVNEIFDASTGTWSSGAPMPQARTAFGGGVTNGGFFIFGGTANGAAPAGTLVYVPATPTTTDGWALLGSMPSPRWGMASAVIGETVYAIGGQVTYQQPIAGENTVTALSTPPASVFKIDAPIAGALPTVQWETSDQSVGMIDVSGHAATFATGQATIFATAGQLSCYASGGCGTLTVTNTAPQVQIVGGPFIYNEGAPALSLTSSINDPDGDPVSAVWSVVSGPGQLNSPSSVSTGFTNADGPSDTTIRLTATDSHGASAFAETTIHTSNVPPSVVIGGTNSPALVGTPISGNGGFSDPGTDNWTATIDYGDGTGQQPLALSGKTFTFTRVYTTAGSYTITVRVSDGAATAQAQTHVDVTAPPPTATPDGRMHGTGHLETGDQHHHFTFRAWQRGSLEAARLEYWVTPKRNNGHNDCGDDNNGGDGDHDDDYGRQHRGAVAFFQAAQITSVTFLDDAAFAPGHGRRQLAVDTVTIAGSGTWKGRSGYTFEARATDQGEPGRNHDMFSITVKDSSGRVVAHVSDALDGGNIQSARLQ